MDAYVHLVDTMTPRVVAAASDQPWQVNSSTQTIVWFAADSPVQRYGVSSLGKPMTFCLMAPPALAGLERLRSFAHWEDNWDGEGAKAPSKDTIEAASKVFSLLAVYDVPQVTLSSDGDPMFIYGKPKRGEVVVTGVGTLDYFFPGDVVFADEDVPFDGTNLPHRLIEHIGVAAAQ